MFVVRKLRVPGDEDLAFGAVASGGTRVLLKSVVDTLDIPPESIEAVDAEERRELERLERALRGDRPPRELSARTVILVDDAITTGATTSAAVRAVRLEDPLRVVVAAPVADAAACDELRTIADKVVCLRTPDPLRSASESFEDFSVPGSDELRRLLERARRPAPASDIGVIDQLHGTAADYDPVVRRAAATDVVLIGEASHGTHEFYRERAQITRRLIAREGLHRRRRRGRLARRLPRQPLRPRRGRGRTSAEEALARLPALPDLDVAQRRRARLRRLAARAQRRACRAGARRSASTASTSTACTPRSQAVLAYLDKVDPEAAERARAAATRCFDHFGEDTAGLRLRARARAGAESCEREVDRAARSSCTGARPSTLAATAMVAEDEYFYAEQNARLVAQRRGVLPHDVPRPASRRGTCATATWPTRSTRSSTTSAATARRPKVVVWAHNSHLGDARATEMGQRGRARTSASSCASATARDAVLVGFTTYTGTVTAASDWDGAAERKRVRPALPGSYEALFHDAELPASCWPAAASDRPAARLREPRLERAIGVIYRPETERAQPLLPRAPRRPVRRRDPLRRDARRRAAGAHRRMGGRRGARALSVGRLTGWRRSAAGRLLRGGGRPGNRRVR